MQLTIAVDYATRALMYLASQPSPKAVLINRIAKQKIHPKVSLPRSCKIYSRQVLSGPEGGPKGDFSWLVMLMSLRCGRWWKR